MFKVRVKICYKGWGTLNFLNKVNYASIVHTTQAIRVSQICYVNLHENIQFFMIYTITKNIGGKKVKCTHQNLKKTSALNTNQQMIDAATYKPL